MRKSGFNGRTVWITGASSGIGRSMALAFAREGARLVLSARNEEALQTLAGECGGSPSPLVVPLDLCQPDAIEPAVARVLAEVNAIDILVNNAGISQRGTAAETGMDVDRRIIRKARVT